MCIISACYDCDCVYNGNDVTVETDMETVWEVMSLVPMRGCVPDCG